jgi:hypothetical protein
MMDFVELQKLLKDAEVRRIAEAGQLGPLGRDVSKVLVDLGTQPVPGIPRDLCTVGHVLEVVGIILERLQEAYASDHHPWD